MTLGERLQRIFDREGWTQEEAADRLGVARPTINKLINNRSAISPEMAVRLETIFGDKAESWIRAQGVADIARARKRLAKWIASQRKR